MKEEVNDSAVQSVTGLNQGVPQEQDSLLLLRRQFHVLRSLARCVELNYLAILVSFLCLYGEESCKYIKNNAVSSSEN
jgi:hypothetical protein